MGQSLDGRNNTEEKQLIEEIRLITQRLTQADCDKSELGRLLEEVLDRYTQYRKGPNSPRS